jgi:hypothetical protein
LSSVEELSDTVDPQLVTISFSYTTSKPLTSAKEHLTAIELCLPAATSSTKFAQLLLQATLLLAFTIRILLELNTDGIHGHYTILSPGNRQTYQIIEIMRTVFFRCSAALRPKIWSQSVKGEGSQREGEEEEKEAYII